MNDDKLHNYFLQLLYTIIKYIKKIELIVHVRPINNRRERVPIYNGV